jgi:hypothetical protein
MAIHILCPHCKTPFVLGDELANQVFTCTTCEGLIQLPPLPPKPLPPIEMIGTYRRVLGNRPPLILQIFGIFTDWRSDSGAGDVFRFIWSLRHLVLLVGIIVFTFGYTGSPRQAENAAPGFLGATIIFLLWGYLDAIWIARKQEEEEGARPDTVFTTLIIDPVAILVSDYREALPVYRAWGLACCLGFACLCVGQRAGSLNFLIPAPIRQYIHTTVPAAADPTAPPSDNAPAAPLNALTPPPAPASAPLPAATRPGYHPENGPPPPPPDQ